MIGSLFIAGSLLGQWTLVGFADDPRPVVRPTTQATAVEHPESVGLPTGAWKPIGPLPERIAPPPKAANIPKLTPDLPKIPPALDPVEMRVPAPSALVEFTPIRVETTAMAEKPVDRAAMAAKMPPPALPAVCVCAEGECSCCSACSCGGKPETKPAEVAPIAITTEPMLFYLTDRFGQLWHSPDKANLEAWVASRNAYQPARWVPTVQPQVYVQPVRRGLFRGRGFGSSCAGGVCQ